jgi:signal transduction histidine kinase
MRDGSPVGAITVWRSTVGLFSDEHIALLQTFADQAVIAIENVRLFTELQEKNRALTQAHAQVTEALEQQTATSEILRVISSSPTDVQPVFYAIVRAAVRLCQAVQSNVQLFDGQLMHFVAAHNIGPTAMEMIQRIYPMPPNRNQTGSRAILDNAVVHVPDVLEDPEYLHELAVQGGWRSVLSVPMVGKGRPIGAITVTRMEPGLFSDTEIALLQTFADQAVIAIENTRLFNETTEALDRQTATSEILQVISSSPTDVHPVFETIARSATALCEAELCHLYRFDGALVHFAAQHGGTPAETTAVQRAFPQPPSRLSVTARAILTAAIVQVADVSEEPEVADSLRMFRTVLSVPMLRDRRPLGAITVARRVVRPFTAKQIDLLKTFADQAVIAIENVRLFKELESANSELAAASQHKSEFLANMSHELRTPLNAIIGFSEVLTDRMFGELNEKQEEYLKDIYASGTHLLSLINDILDLSKIEAGRMELELTDFDLPTALDNAIILVRERAARHGISLHKSFDERLGHIHADERKVRQVILNLLSNAIKFTPEGGRIEVQVAPKDGQVEVSVSDTGVGIAPEDQEAVFEEFRQVGTAAKKIEGTGLGLTLCRKFVELHGGRIWVESELGVGSTFTFSLPLRSA